MKKILIVVATHGDEPIGLQVVNSLKEKGVGNMFETLVANPRALKLKKRFADFDLNRAYPGDKDSVLYEKRLAVKNLEFAQKFDFIIDLHEASCGTEDFIIIPKDTANIRFPVKLMTLDKVLLWPEPFGPLSQVLDNSIELEFGMKDRERRAVIAKASSVIIKFLRAINEQKNVESKQSIYRVYGQLKIDECGESKNLIDFQETEISNEQFLPLLVDQYLADGVKCYKMRKINN